MKKFTFLCKPEVIHGRGSTEALSESIRELNGSKALIVVDSFLSAHPMFTKIKNNLEKDNIPFYVFDKIDGEPSTETGDECAQYGKENGCDIVVGIGGGSSLDAAKAVSVLMTNEGTVRDYQGLNKVPKPGFPKIMVPTTAGTGSEVTFTAVFIRKDEKKKGGINSSFLFPDIAILDPVLTVSVPPAVTASTGLDALCHALESYTSKKASLLSDIVSEEGIRRIWKSLPTAFSEGSNLDARENMLYGSFLAGIGLANAGVTAVHSISYPLGGTFGIAHGIGNGLLLPYVLKFNLPAIAEKLGTLAKKLNKQWENLSDIEAADSFVGAIEEFLTTFKIPTLKQLNVPPDSFSQLAEDSLKIAVPIENNPREISKEDIIQIYKKAY